MIKKILILTAAMLCSANLFCETFLVRNLSGGDVGSIRVESYDYGEGTRAINLPFEMKYKSPEKSMTREKLRGVTVWWEQNGKKYRTQKFLMPNYIEIGPDGSFKSSDIVLDDRKNIIGRTEIKGKATIVK